MPRLAATSHPPASTPPPAHITKHSGPLEPIPGKSSVTYYVTLNFFYSERKTPALRALPPASTRAVRLAAIS